MILLYCYWYWQYHPCILRNIIPVSKDKKVDWINFYIISLNSWFVLSLYTSHSTKNCGIISSAVYEMLPDIDSNRQTDVSCNFSLLVFLWFLSKIMLLKRVHGFSVGKIRDLSNYLQASISSFLNWFNLFCDILTPLNWLINRIQLKVNLINQKYIAFNMSNLCI